MTIPLVLPRGKNKYHNIILGDLNINIKNHVCSNSKTYKNLLLSLGLRNVINIPTRVSSSTETMLDHCLTNLPINNVVSGVLKDNLSDHFPIFAFVNLNTRITQIPSHHIYRNFPFSKKPVFLQRLNDTLSTSFELDPSQPLQSLKKFISIFRKKFSVCSVLTQAASVKRWGISDK